MSRPPQKKKQVREEKTTEQTMISAAINSQYNTCTPMWNAEHIRICDPITRLDKTFGVDKPEFFEYFAKLCDRGMGDRLFKELTWFKTEIDPAWDRVYNNLVEYMNKREVAANAGLD